MSDPQPQQLEPINIEAFEKLVYAHKYEESFSELIKILVATKRGSGFAWYGEQPAIEMLFTRIASAIGALFADPGFGLSPDGFCRVMIDHPTLHSIFKASVYKNMDYVAWIFGNRDAVTPTKVNFTGEHIIPKLLVCWSLESGIDIDVEEISRHAPYHAGVAMIGYLGIGGVHSERAYNRKVALMKKLPLIQNIALNELMLGAMGDVYMHCSYVDEPDKHEIKKVLNVQYRRIVESRLQPGQLPERTQLVEKERPTIVVPLEWFGSHHAMFRCYAPSIRELRKGFNVIGIGRSGEVDDKSRLEFDKFLDIPGNDASIFQMAEMIMTEEPDIMFYPSIGMAAWWVALSNFRLAPIQIMAPGHPATSHSKCIDYIISDGDLFGDETLYSERCIHLPVGATRYIRREGLEPEKLKRDNYHKFRLGIPAMVMKLTPPFLKTLRRIYDEARDSVEFHFFPNQVASSHYLIVRELRAWIPDCVVHERMEYQPYMSALAQCDLMLSTFPFGGTNSTIDAFLAGVPVLTLEGNQIHSRSDASMIRRMGLSRSTFITDSVDAYVERALWLIRNGLPTYDTGPLLDFDDVIKEFYGDAPPGLEDAWLLAFKQIYGGRISEQKS